MSIVASPRQHFGDLLGGADKQGVEEEIVARFANPIDRLLLTADGTLQMLVSAWHDRVVQVRVVKHEPNYDNASVDRQIELCFADEEPPQPSFCTATSTVRFESNDLMERARGFGIGQLFREWDLLPRFELLDAGRGSDDDTLWRKYKLSAKGIECIIHESFPCNPLSIDSIPLESNGKASPVSLPGLVSDARFQDVASPNLTKIQRVFCMANGNVQRLATALLGEPVCVKLRREWKTTPTEYYRLVELVGSNTKTIVCEAHTRINLKEDDEIVSRLDNGTLPPGSIVREVGSYPKFKLIECKWTSPVDFSRTYSLSLRNASIQLLVTERFDWKENTVLGDLSNQFRNL